MVMLATVPENPASILETTEPELNQTLLEASGTIPVDQFAAVDQLESDAPSQVTISAWTGAKNMLKITAGSSTEKGRYLSK